MKENFGENPKPKAEVRMDTLETLQTIEYEVAADIEPLLRHINNDLGIQLGPRPEGLHVTIMTQRETPVFSRFNETQLEELRAIESELARGEGIEVKGIGFIDGGQTENIRPADRAKKTCFLALGIPRLQAFRRSLGLREKDFHITLGFVGGDISMGVVGKDPKGKDILRPIPKKADHEFDRYLSELPELSFGKLSGEEKQKPRS